MSVRDTNISLPVGTYLIPYYYSLSIWSPCERDCSTKAIDFANCSFGPSIPELDNPVATDTAQFCIFNGVECDFLDAGIVPLKICGVSDILSLWVPAARISNVSRNADDDLHSKCSIC